jgi:parallel beta-helix repeat protein
MEIDNRIISALAFSFIVILLASPTQAGYSDFQSSEPGSIEGTGTHFEITDSDFINVILDSTESINLNLNSKPELVTLVLSSESAVSTTITLGGFAPNTTYYKYEDDFHNEVDFTTDENGSYTYTQDLSQEHLIFIQTQPSTIFISLSATGGGCALALTAPGSGGTQGAGGTWNAATKTCTLNNDLGQTVQIDASGITLDGAGHKITRTTGSVGVIIPSGKNDVTIKNLEISGFSTGIDVKGNTFTIDGNTIKMNTDGIVSRGNNGRITNNLVSTNTDHGLKIEDGGPLTIMDNIFELNGAASGHGEGIDIKNGATGGNTITRNTFRSNDVGLELRSDGGDIVYQNNFIDNTSGQVRINGGATANLYRSLPDGGNYWSNFSPTCVDTAVPIGICDLPFLPSHGRDNFVWKTANGWSATAPTVTPTVTGPLGSNGWYVGDVTISWTVTGTPTPTTTGCETTVINTDTAGITLTCSATNSGGSASQSVTIKRDTVLPKILLSETGPTLNKITVRISELVTGDGLGWSVEDNTVLVVSDMTTPTDTVELTLGTPLSSSATPNVLYTAGDTVTDGAENEMESQTVVAIDKLSPSLSSVSISSDNSNSAFAKTGDIVIVTFTANEPISPPTVTIGGSPADTVVNTVGNSWEATRLMQSTDLEGTVPFTIDFSDLADNLGVQVTATTDASAVLFDITNPTTTITSATDGTGTPSPVTGTVPTRFDSIVIYFTPDDGVSGSGIASSTCTLDGGSSTPCGPTSVSYSGLSEGTHTVSIFSTDNAGNTGATVSFTWTVDLTPPDLTVPASFTVEANDPLGAVGVTFATSATDNYDTDVDIQCTPASGSTFGYTPPTPTDTPVICNATDDAGNVATKSFTVTVQDTTPPAVTATFERDPDNNGWYNHDVVISFAGVDIVDTTPTCDVPVTYSGPDGDNTSITGNCTDDTGNVGSATPVFDYDETAPVVTPPPNVTFAATSSAGAVVTYDAAGFFDATSGLDTTSSTPASGSTLPIALNVITHTATDVAGNTATATSTANVFDVKIDNVSPIAQGSQVYVTIKDEARDFDDLTAETTPFTARSATGDAAGQTGISIDATATTTDGFVFRNALDSFVITSEATNAATGRLNLGGGGYDDIFVKYTSTGGVFKEVTATTELSGGAGRPVTAADPIRWSSDTIIVEGSATVKVFDSTKKNGVPGETITATVFSSADPTPRTVTLTEDPVPAGSADADTGTFTTPGRIIPSALASLFDATIQRLNAPATSTTTSTLTATYGANTATAVVTTSDIPVLGAIAVSTSAASCGVGGDTDNDGICNSWETQSISLTGLKINYIGIAPYSYTCRPQIDDTSGNPAGTPYSAHVKGTVATGPLPVTTDGCPSATMRDIYAEIDYMPGHKPSRVALGKVIDAFAAAPDPDGTGPIQAGIKLHIQLDESYGFHRDVIPYGSDPSPSIEGFQELKTKRFGKNTGERVQVGKDATFISNYLTNKRQVFHYGAILHDLEGRVGSSGIGEVGGNDFVVTLGSFTGNTGTDDEMASTFMHELGHNLNLNHGGLPLDIVDDPATVGVNEALSINCKPNYLSIMNYAFQFADPVADRPLDYSRTALPTLDEISGLSETAGVGQATPTSWRTVYGPVTGVSPFTSVIVTAGPLSLLSNPIDWNRDGSTSGAPSLAVHYIPTLGCDDSSLRQLVGYNDWASMALNFKGSSFFSDGLSSFQTELGVGTASFTSDVPDATPFVREMTAPVSAFRAGTVQTFSGVLEDANEAGESHTATWIWGDGSPSTDATVVNQPSPPGAGDTTVANVGPTTHSYATRGIYALNLRVTDSALPPLSSTTEFPTLIPVYDPTMKGQAVANEKFDSPVGALRIFDATGKTTGVPDTSLDGTVKFELEGKYNKDEKLSGKLKFKLEDKDPKPKTRFELEHTKLEWLITKNNQAHMKGTGTKLEYKVGKDKIIEERTGTYGFIASLLDGNPDGGKGNDKIRIRIWDPSIGDEYNVNAIIYDNMCVDPTSPFLADDPTLCVRLYEQPTTVIKDGTVKIKN